MTPDLVMTSGREDLSIKERIGLMRATLFFPPFNGITKDTPAATQAIHDLKLMIGRIRNTIELYDRAVARGETEERLAKGADRMLSDTECLILAWKRGGHLEYERVRRAQMEREP